MFIVNNKKIFIGISAVLVLISLVLLFTVGLRESIDFKGGALTEISYPSGRPVVEDLQKQIDTLALGTVLLQPTGDNGYLVKTMDLTETNRQALFNSFSIDGKYIAEQKSFTSIGPSVGSEMRKKALLSIVLVILAIMFFVAYAFRKVAKPISSWTYGLVTIITLVHDVIIPTGIYVLLGKYAGAEADMLFVVALLTILGLSVSDTIVVFDRIRENLKIQIAPTFKEIVGRSIMQTFARSINTSLTVIFALLALFFFGPSATKYFALTLAAGMFFGAYSSIFLASPLLVMIEERKKNKTSKK